MKEQKVNRRQSKKKRNEAKGREQQPSTTFARNVRPGIGQPLLHHWFVVFKSGSRAGITEADNRPFTDRSRDQDLPWGAWRTWRTGDKGHREKEMQDALTTQASFIPRWVSPRGARFRGGTTLRFYRAVADASSLPGFAGARTSRATPMTPNTRTPSASLRGIKL